MWKFYTSRKSSNFDESFYSPIQEIMQSILILSLYGYWFYGIFTEKIYLLFGKLICRIKICNELSFYHILGM